MLLLNIYYIITISITSFYFYDLYRIEYSFYIFSINITKSLFYVCLFINLIFMIFLFLGNLIIYILFGKITLTELKELKKEIFYKFFRLFHSFDLFLLYKIENIGQKLFLQIIGLYMSFITDITYKRGEYYNTKNEKNKLYQFKIILINIILICLNYILYTLTIPENEKKTQDLFYNLFLSYMINYDSFHSFIKIFEGFYKLMINITIINMEKYWNHKIFAFNIISIIKYLFYISYEAKVNYILIKNQKFRSHFFVCSLSSIAELIILVKRIYIDCSYLKYIKSLTDYDINEELKIQGEINNNMNEEDIKRIKKEKINNCIICFYEIEKGKYLNCGHIFHYNCIKEWILHYKKCPTCNVPIEIHSNKKSHFYNKRLGVKNKNENCFKNSKNSINNNELILNNKTKEIEIKQIKEKEKILFYKYKSDDIKDNKNL